MRITGGLYRGRTVICPPGIIRPAMDRMRESLFDQLGDMSGRSWLDLFSGSGCVGIEAASRNASPVVLVEMDRGKRETILRNISFVKSDISLVMCDVWKFLPTTKRQFHYIYADPPFAMEGKIRLAQSIDHEGLLVASGLFIIHYPSEEKDLWPEAIGRLETIDQRKYGRSMLRFYRNAEEPIHA
jgi:16S rRNA (guanine(966)-N(2))-methyltransferase RsmD